MLEIGGTHVSAALVDPDSGRLAGQPTRRALDAQGSAPDILATIVAVGRTIGAAPGARWGVAIPDPFDYLRGIGRFAGVGKFAALRGVEVGAAFARGLGGSVAFGNDADAFILGEWRHGAARGTARCAGITLGTGVGSGWLVDGRIVDSGPGVPPGGRAHRLTVDGVELEERMSRRAVRAAYARATGDADADVRVIAERARAGDKQATAVLAAAVQCLGRALGPALRGFAADVVVIGGAMAGSWDLFDEWFRAGGGTGLPPLCLARQPAVAALLGAAEFAREAKPLTHADEDPGVG